MLLLNSWENPKKCDLYIGFSRDGIQFSRLNRKPFIAGSGVHGAWDEGYIHPASGICIVNGDELLFYFGAWSGNSPRMGETYVCWWKLQEWQHFAEMAFAALTTNSTGRMSTPPVCFHGEGLWVNAQCKSLRAEIQDKNGHALPGLSFSELYLPLCQFHKAASPMEFCSLTSCYIRKARAYCF